MRSSSITIEPRMVRWGSTILALLRMWRSMLFELGFQREDPPPNMIGNALHEVNHDDDDEEAGQHVAVAEHAAGHVQLEADPSAAEHTERDRSPEIDVEGVEDVGHDGRRHL